MRRRGRGAAPALLAATLSTVAALLFAPTTAVAGDVPSRAEATRPAFDPKTFDPKAFDPRTFELRLGTFVHDSLSPERGSVDINAEVLMAPFHPPPSALSWLAPRLHAGATVNTAGKTSSLYAGLTWTFDLTQSLFAEMSLGGAVHNGTIGQMPVAGHNAMGCRAAFRETASLGYRFTRQFAVMGTVEHMSNAGLCARNRGLTNFGLRAAWSF